VTARRLREKIRARDTPVSRIIVRQIAVNFAAKEDFLRFIIADLSYGIL
jgi:hypothetical protein